MFTASFNVYFPVYLDIVKRIYKSDKKEQNNHALISQFLENKFYSLSKNNISQESSRDIFTIWL